VTRSGGPWSHSYLCRVQSANELDVKSVFDCQELTVILALNSAKLSHVGTFNRMFLCVVVPVAMCGSAAERPTHRDRRRHAPSVQAMDRCTAHASRARPSGGRLALATLIMPIMPTMFIMPIMPTMTIMPIMQGRSMRHTQRTAQLEIRRAVRARGGAAALRRQRRLGACFRSGYARLSVPLFFGLSVPLLYGISVPLLYGISVPLFFGLAVPLLYVISIPCVAADPCPFVQRTETVRVLRVRTVS
jgi:hypothetical protein